MPSVTLVDIALSDREGGDMDVNETIVQAWLETKDYLVRRRLRYDLSAGSWSSVSDVDLLAYSPKKDERLAVLITAWMTQRISPSHLKPGGIISKKLSNFLSPQADKAIRAELNPPAGKNYERWFVVGKVSPAAEAAIVSGFPGIKVITFDIVMQELVNWIKNDQLYLPHESETLQTIRALVWTKLL